MTRPSKRLVDAALQDVATSGRHAYAKATTDVLAAEVRALRAELAEARRNAELHNDAANAAELRIVELRATIARVEALPAKWLDDVAYQRESVAQCTIDVEVVLRGEEP